MLNDKNSLFGTESSPNFRLCSIICRIAICSGSGNPPPIFIMMLANGIQISDSGLIVKRHFAINRLKILDFGDTSRILPECCF